MIILCTGDGIACRLRFVDGGADFGGDGVISAITSGIAVPSAVFKQLRVVAVLLMLALFSDIEKRK